MSKKGSKAIAYQAFSVKLNIIIGFIGILIGLLLMPPIFSRYISLSPLIGSDEIWLWSFFSFLALMSLLLIFFKKRIKPEIGLLFFSFLLIISLEVGTRIYLGFVANPKLISQLGKLTYWTHPEYSAFVGHPFLQFTGRPAKIYEGNEFLGGLGAFNNFGFSGDDFQYNKEDGVIRIVAMGESTTADGWPLILEDELNKKRSDGSYRFEVMNFASGAWNSAHSMVNFFLNVVEFSPDFIIIHHGWNELGIRNVYPDEFRTDYSHALKYFHEPEIYDRYLLRISIIYRYFKILFDPSPQWTFLGASINHERTEIEPFFQNLNELKPYRRNIETIIDHSIMKGIKVILTTLPHSTDESSPLFYGHTSIEQCNDITREIAIRYHGQIEFIDLDKLMTGKMNHVFTDLGHTTNEGREFKAKMVQDKIWDHSMELRRYFEKAYPKDQSLEYKKGTVEYYEKRIRRDKDWLNIIAIDARRKNRNLEELILENAQYMARQDSLKNQQE